MIVSCHAIIEKGDQVILTREANKPGLKFVGGKLENGETLSECLQREAKEEIGSEIEVGGLISVYNYLDKKRESCVRFYFLAKFLSGPASSQSEVINEVICINRKELAQLKAADFYRQAYYLAIVDYLANNKLPVHYEETYE